MKYETCPICGYDEMPYAPVPENICPCCGTQFGFDDRYHSPQELRSMWIEQAFPFFSDYRTPPKNWRPYRQLIIAGHGVDLVDHPRMKTDEDYRYAVEEAFSDVRMAMQLRVLRETRNVPLTQAQLAEKAEMKQSRISELEGMNYSSWSISTLRRLARAVGVRLEFRCESWGALVPLMAGGLSREALFVPSFEDDPAFKDDSTSAPQHPFMPQPPPQTSTLAPYAEFLTKRTQSEVNRQRATQQQDPLAELVANRR